ncbi:MAG: hypothetical protein IH991_14175 [Planctomycetes bacterium]|nr:hypothetical protein [Planctomycetota bacterium]
MPIKVQCNSCGAGFAAKDELAGRRVACPKCKKPIVIPAPASGAMDDLLDEIGFGAGTATGGKQCPSCRATMAPNAVVCVNCSYNVQTGKRMVASGADLLPGSELDIVEELMSKAEIDLQNAPLKHSDAASGEGLMSYAIAFGALVVAAALVAMGVLFVKEMGKEGTNAWLAASDGMRWFALAISLAAYGEIIYRAFRYFGPLHGGLSVIPIYGYFFAVIKSPNFLRPLLVLLVAWNFEYLSRLLLLMGAAIQADLGFKGIAVALLLGIIAVGWNLIYWGWVQITGTAYDEDFGGITHGTLSLLAFGYAFAYGFYRAEQPYTKYAAYGVGGFALILSQIVTATLMRAAD